MEGSLPRRSANTRSLCLPKTLLGHALARRVFHAPGVVDIGEQEVAALLPPEWKIATIHASSGLTH
jgi:hypothetical protein